MGRSLLKPALETGQGDADRPSVAALWDAVDLFRLFALFYAVYEFWSRLAEVARPALGWAILAVLAAWTAAMLWHRTRTSRQLWIELLLCTGSIVATRWVDDPIVRESGVSTVPGIWAGAIVLAAGVYRGPVAAFGAWAAVAVADIVEIGSPTEGTIHNIVLLLVMAGCAGLSSQAARRADDAARASARLRAETAERERLARTVHDGVLQALSYIHRRGGELGGPAHELGDLAAAQEQRLRDLIATPIHDPFPAPGSEPETDLAVALRASVGQDAQIAAPADVIALPTRRAGELVAAVAAAVDNARRHAGPDAGTWILLEADGADVVVTVRDDGAGIPAGGLDAARARGRLGVSASIVGRIEGLGGTATCHSSPGAGTSWELRIPARPRGD